ncbi:MAG: Glycosyl transferase, UDP-glucuronosyltransferase [Parcubacteria group bacterium GW2011_GWA1_40_21]|nr:MAG: Glycosyl transferase, UDP-glucuronosyltransferase [Parcubacteria group bacterium GW2011_GWA1_40_21]
MSLKQVNSKISARMLKKKRFLFFPLEIGLAHITRSIAIAEKMITDGHDAYVVVPGKKIELFKDTIVTLIPTEIYDNSEDSHPLHKFRDVEYLYHISKKEQEIIEKIAPDCVVVDYRLSALIACMMCGKKTVFISDGGWGPHDFAMPNPGIEKTIFRTFGFAADFLFKYLKGKFIKSLFIAAKKRGFIGYKKDIIHSILYIAPEFTNYLPAKKSLPKIECVGPIFWSGFERFGDQSVKNLKPDGKTVYLTFGGTGFDGEKLISLSDAIAKKGYRVLVSSSIIADVKNFPKHDKLLPFKFVDGKKASEIADLIVCHGGYGTMMQAMLAGKPVVAIPYNFSQLIHSLRFQELGLGKCVSKKSIRNIVYLIANMWERFERNARKVQTQDILNDIEEVMQNYEKYKKRIEKFIANDKYCNGSSAAADLIYDFLSK